MNNIKKENKEDWVCKLIKLALENNEAINLVAYSHVKSIDILKKLTDKICGLSQRLDNLQKIINPGNVREEVNTSSFLKDTNKRFVKN